ncbi:hypothetical protein Q9R32_04040 [Actinotalea sp. AC32]|nr:hypothetical protein [Actinotalea sp. AC32]
MTDGPVEAPAPSASRTVLGRGSLYTLATAAPALAAVAVVPAVTRALPVAEYDLVAVATVVVQVTYILLGLGMGAAITRQHLLDAAGATGSRVLVLQGAALAGVLGAVATATSAWWSPLVLGRPASTELVLALAASLGGAWMVLAQAYLRGEDRVRSFVGLAALAGLAGPALGLVGVLAVERSANAYLVGLAAGYVTAGLTGLGLVVASGPARGRRGGLRAALRIGLPTVPHQVSLYLALAGLVVIADRLLGEGGRANVALTFGAGATVVTAGLNNAWAPLVYRTPPAERGPVLTETTRSVGLVTVTLSGGLALLAPWVLAVAAPARYATDGLVPALALAAAAAVPSVVYLASGHLVFAEGRTHGLAVTTPLAVAGGLAVAAAAASSWGVTATGAGYLGAYLLLATGTTALQRRVAGHAWRPPGMPLVLTLWVLTTVGGVLLPTDGAGVTWRWGGAVVLVVVAAAGLSGRGPSWGRRRGAAHPAG